MAVVFGLLKGTPMECCPLFSIDGNTEIPIRNQTDEKLKNDDEEPESGKVYQLTGGSGEKCLSNGNSWEESKVANSMKELNKEFEIDDMERVDEMETLKEQGFSDEEIKEMVWE